MIHFRLSYYNFNDHAIHNYALSLKWTGATRSMGTIDPLQGFFIHHAIHNYVRTKPEVDGADDC